MEKAIIKYKLTLKAFYRIDTTNKDYERLYHKLNGMESILEAMDVNTNFIRRDVLNQIK